MRFGWSENVGVKKTFELVTDIRDYNIQRVPDIKSSFEFIFFWNEGGRGGV